MNNSRIGQIESIFVDWCLYWFPFLNVALWAYPGYKEFDRVARTPDAQLQEWEIPYKNRMRKYIRLSYRFLLFAAILFLFTLLLPPSSSSTSSSMLLVGLILNILPLCAIFAAALIGARLYRIGPELNKKIETSSSQSEPRP